MHRDPASDPVHVAVKFLVGHQRGRAGEHCGPFVPDGLFVDLALLGDGVTRLAEHVADGVQVDLLRRERRAEAGAAQRGEQSEARVHGCASSGAPSAFMYAMRAVLSTGLAAASLRA